MTISVAAQDTNSGSGATLPLTLLSTEGNVQQVYATHRSGSMTPDIDGTGWTQTLIETQIGNTSARRAIVRWRRIVPAGASATINAGWAASADIVVFGIEFATDTVGGAWVFDGTDDGSDATDNATTAGTSLASASVTPTNAEAFAIDALVARHGQIAANDEDTYTDSFVNGPDGNTVSGDLANNISGFSGYRIVDATPAATSTTASWTTSALATSIIDVWSVDSGAAGTPVGQAAETDTAQPVGSAKTKTLGQASETDSAQAVTSAKTKPLGGAAETDSAQPITALKALAVRQAAETDLAQAVTFVGATPVGQAAENDVALPVTARKVRTIGQATETDLAQSITFVAGTPVAQAVETDQALGITARKTKALGLAVETDLALAFTTEELVTPASRRFTVIAEDRTFSVLAEDRTFAVTIGSRGFAVT